MELEELNKTQIVLLTLLVSFVTSIATGIVTVTLLDQAPQGVTRTINRVVERTIERVVLAPDSDKGITVIEKEITIVVKEDDLITESIEQNSRNIVRLHKVIRKGEELVFDDEGLLSLGTFIGIGIVATTEGLISVDSSLVEPDSDVIVRLSSGERLLGVVVDTNTESSFALIQVPLPEDESIRLRPATFTTEGSLKLGQTTISLSGEERTNVSIGIISAFVESEENEAGETRLATIVTSIDTDVLVGSPLINIFGEVIGIKITENAVGAFSPVSALRVQIVNYKSTLEPTEED